MAIACRRRRRRPRFGRRILRDWVSERTPPPHSLAALEKAQIAKKEERRGEEQAWTIGVISDRGGDSANSIPQHGYGCCLKQIC